MGQITFARVDGPPHNWRTLKVINLATGTEVRDVVEVDTEERYLIRFRRDPRGELVLAENKQEVARERITGDFQIEADGLMEEALRAYLAADAPLTGLVADEIQWGRRNGVPAVTLHLITAPPARSLKGPAGLVIALVQADCRALTFLSAKAIGDAVADALPPKGLTFEGVKFLNCAVMDTERTTEGEGQNTLFRTRHDLRVSYHLI